MHSIDPDPLSPREQDLEEEWRSKLTTELNEALEDRYNMYQRDLAAYQQSPLQGVLVRHLGSHTLSSHELSTSSLRILLHGLRMCNVPVACVMCRHRSCPRTSSSAITSECCSRSPSTTSCTRWRRAVRTSSSQTSCKRRSQCAHRQRTHTRSRCTVTSSGGRWRSLLQAQTPSIIASRSAGCWRSARRCAVVCSRSPLPISQSVR